MFELINRTDGFHLYYLITNDIRNDIFSGISHVAEHTLLLPIKEEIHFVGKGYTGINHVCLNFSCSSLEALQEIDRGIIHGDIITEKNVDCAKYQVSQELRRLEVATKENEELIKFVTERDYDTYGKSINDMPIFRYAEILLNYAEAKAELGILEQNDLDKSIKLIRDRVAMPNINMNNANSNPDHYLEKQYPHVNGENKGVILEIRRERRIELVMESFRWDDMMRWKEGATFVEQLKGMYFPGLGTFDLDGNGEIDICLYDGEKPEIDGKSIQYLKLNSDVTLENGNSGCIVVNPHISPNIFIKDVSVSLGYDANHFENDTIILYTMDS